MWWVCGMVGLGLWGWIICFWLGLVFIFGYIFRIVGCEVYNYLWVVEG